MDAKAPGMKTGGRSSHRFHHIRSSAEPPVGLLHVNTLEPDKSHTAKMHGLDPQTYLADVLDRIISGRTKVNALSELLPWHWKAARAAQEAAAA